MLLPLENVFHICHADRCAHFPVSSVIVTSDDLPPSHCYPLQKPRDYVSRDWNVATETNCHRAGML